MPVTFRIPKLSDREITSALVKIRDSFRTANPSRQLRVVIHIPHHGGVNLRDETPIETPELKFVFDAESQVIGTFQLVDEPTGNEAFVVRREPEKVTDSASLSDHWFQNIRDPNLQAQFPHLHVSLLSAARSELKANDVEAAFKGADDTAWNRYRDAQTAVVNSLQQATETLILKASEQNAELDRRRSERFEKLESDLRAQLDKDRKELQFAHDQRLEALRTREKALADKESSFNTKESHYVARQKQTEQIEKIQSWLDNWSLTKGTSRKRWPIATAYVAAILFSGALTIYATWHSYDVLKSADEIVKLAWWQWAAIWAKSFFPLAAFATFIIYFIRWSGDWARQHSEEEFRNRTRLIDIGRSSWLLEAVRDAQERDKEIPPDLLRELSRNLFATSVGTDRDLHPQAVSDLLLQGLSSVRVKAADGSEAEAKRNKK